MPRRLLLVGGGHVHLHILKKLQQHPIPNVEVNLLSPFPIQYYSGMLSGFVEGLYAEEQIGVNLRKLCEAAGVSFIEDRVASLDAVSQTVITERTRRMLKYDAVSFNIGSEVAATDIPGVKMFGIRVKPMELFIQFINQLDFSERILVVGGGASGIELALSLRARQRQQPGLEMSPDRITIVTSGALMGVSNSWIESKLMHILSRKGLTFYTNKAVMKVHENHVILNSGVTLSFDRLLWLTGPKAPDLFGKSGLKVRDQGYLLVNPTLQSVDFPNIFGAGDCVAIDAYAPLPKSGVYAVKEAPVLWANLLHYFNGQRLVNYHPHTPSLSLLSTGNREAFLIYGKVIFHSKWFWKLKNKIDSRFMRNYQ
ncbi:FAD-dependent oxidoreductase [Cohnella luojiensis]|uniref:Pyridine nucleotide-disulfide oxidoreductase n=1 Tax=Cohnella luojiensis TaxID=652876 RepID=A0A4Y8M1Q9_9BACL|nr:FAD-dependent oxidoreductase [Cohnella luojiensis]TFE27551.1 pyridine nucleotide-disulfide oxidoreductase [Cohnella luojiensis]